MDYEKEKKNNEEKFMVVLQATRPDLWAIANLIDTTNVNWKVLWKVAYHLENISSRTKYGKVVVEIEDNVVRFVRSDVADRVNEPLLLVTEDA